MQTSTRRVHVNVEEIDASFSCHSRGTNNTEMALKLCPAMAARPLILKLFHHCVITLNERTKLHIQVSNNELDLSDTSDSIWSTAIISI